MVSNSSSLGDDFGQLGSAVSEGAKDVGQFLGLVDDDLVPGDPAATGEIAAHLTKLGGAFERAGQGFQKIDTGSWQGRTADAARGHLETAPPKWLKAGDTFGDAGQAVADYQRVLAEAKRTAARAKADLERAQQASDAARSAHNARVDSYNAAAGQAGNGGAAPPTPPGTFHDPAAADIAAAQRAIEQARTAVREAGDRAARAVLAAAEAAPAEPGLMTQIKENLVDSAQAAGRTVGSVAEGAVGAVVDLGKLVRTIAPLDPYKITHPAQAQENMATLAMGVVGAVQNPYGAAKTVVDVDGWKNEPAKTMGACIPDAIASIAGGAGAASRVARSVGKVADHAGDLGHAGTHAEDLARSPAAAHPEIPRHPQPLTTQWGRWPEPAQRPDMPGQHSDPAQQPSAHRDHPEPSRPDSAEHDQHKQPWRPSDPITPSSRGERAFAEPPSARTPDGPDTSRHPERLPHPGPDQPHPLRPDHPGHEPHPARDRADPPESPVAHEVGEHQPRHDGAPGRHEDGDADQPRDQDAADDHTPTPEGHGHPDEPRFEGTPLLERYHGEQFPGNAEFGTPVTYLDEARRQDFKLHVDDDGLLRDADGDLFDTSKAYTAHTEEGGRAIFVMDQHGEIYASMQQKVGEFHHSSFLGGQPVATAGELGVKDGVLRLISNNSGHYQPSQDSTLEFLKHLYKDKGAVRDLENLQVFYAVGSK